MPKRRTSPSAAPQSLSKYCKNFSFDELLKNNDDEAFCYKRNLVSCRTNDKFQVIRRVYNFEYSNLKKCADPFEQLVGDISDTFKLILFEDSAVEKVGISVTSDALTSPIEIPFARIDQEIGQLFENYLFKLQQSDRLVPLFSEPLKVVFTTYKSPAKIPLVIGSGFDPLMGNIDEKNLINVIMSDHFCLFYSILASILYVLTRGINNKKTPEQRSLSTKFNKIYKNVQKYAQLLRDEVLELLDKVEIDPNLNGYNLTHAQKVQDYFIKTFDDKYCILIFGVNSYVKPIFKGQVENPEFYLPLFFFNNHFYAIKNLNLFCSGKPGYQFCVPCLATYKGVDRHSTSCSRKCNYCNRLSRFPCKREVSVFCNICSRTFPNSECHSYHLTNKICLKFIYCSDCGITWRTRDKIPHVCNQRYCNICHSTHPIDDHCFIQIYKLSEKPVVRYIFFDFETLQDDEVRKGVYEHEVNFVCAIVTCSNCLREENFMAQNDCKVCGEKIKIWSGPLGNNCIYEFTEWIIFGFTDKKIKTYAFAHFGMKFDFLFVLRQLFEFKLTPSVIKRGVKFFEIHVPKGKNSGDVHFRDTYNFLPMPLSKFVKTFDLPVSPKGIFPFLWNCKANYFLPEMPHLPPREFYSIKTMTTAKKVEFENWYTANYNTPFFLPRELMEYGINDVLILAHGFVAFRKLFMEMADGLNPFVEGITIPSACMKLFRYKFLTEKTLALVPFKGYQRQSKSSLEAQKYFAWREFKYGKRIQHRNSPGGEKKIGNYLVDGFIEDENLIIEYLGCVWHAHNCLKPGTILPTGRTVKKEADRTKNRIDHLKSMGYNVECIWSCETQKLLKKDPEMKQFYDNVILSGPIVPNDAFFGGRTNPHHLHLKKSPGRKILYVDFCSLYPWALYTNPIPIGHPEIIEVPFDKENVHWTSPSDYDIKGLIKVFIIPPTDLLFPVVPLRAKDFLLMPLCKACSLLYTDEENSRQIRKCDHDSKARGWVATLTHLELDLALEHKYSVTKFYGAYKYEKWSTTLFQSYVRRFLECKVHADGWPPGIDTEEKKHEFIRLYKELFGLNLVYSKFIRNESLRQIAKLALNNLFGKFGMRNNMSRTLITADPLELEKIFDEDKFELCSIDLLNDDHSVMVVYNEVEEFIREHDCSNIIVALFTTSAARVKLYSAMDTIAQLNKTNAADPSKHIILGYTDTDSLIFECPEDMNPLPIGPFLGDLTNEVKPHEEILEAVIGGPKQYGLKIRNKLTNEINYSIKCRGITYDDETSNILTFDKFKDMILNYSTENKVPLSYHQIRPTRLGHVYTKEVSKTYKVIYKKGFVGPDLTVYPYGFCLS